MDREIRYESSSVGHRTAQSTGTQVCPQGTAVSEQVPRGRVGKVWRVQKEDERTARGGHAEAPGDESMAVW